MVRCEEMMEGQWDSDDVALDAFYIRTQTQGDYLEKVGTYCNWALGLTVVGYTYLTERLTSVLWDSHQGTGTHYAMPCAYENNCSTLV